MLVQHNQKYLKEVTVIPFTHEFERMMSGFGKLSDCTPEVRGYGNGLVIATSQRQVGYASDLPEQGMFSV